MVWGSNVDRSRERLGHKTGVWFNPKDARKTLEFSI